MTSGADIEFKREGKHGDQGYVDADTDLIPNVYEGGLKTWEGGVDLVQVLSDVEGGAAAWLAGKRSLEVRPYSSSSFTWTDVVWV